jgi:hypothetical protein
MRGVSLLFFSTLVLDTLSVAHFHSTFTFPLYIAEAVAVWAASDIGASLSAEFLFTNVH